MLNTLLSVQYSLFYLGPNVMYFYFGVHILQALLELRVKHVFLPSFVLSTYFIKSMAAAQHVPKTCVYKPRDQNKCVWISNVTVSPLMLRTDGALSRVKLWDAVGKYGLLITFAQKFLTLILMWMWVFTALRSLFTDFIIGSE